MQKQKKLNTSAKRRFRKMKKGNYVTRPNTQHIQAQVSNKTHCRLTCLLNCSFHTNQPVSSLTHNEGEKKKKKERKGKGKGKLRIMQSIWTPNQARSFLCFLYPRALGGPQRLLLSTNASPCWE